MTSSHPLQDVRRVLEKQVFDLAALLSPPLPVFTDNEFYEDVNLNDQFILLRLSFGSMQVVGLMQSMEDITGTFIAEIYTRKGEGPSVCQQTSFLLMSRLNKLNNIFFPPDPETGVKVKIGPIFGPTFFMPDNREHFACRLNTSFRATVPTLARPLLDGVGDPILDGAGAPIEA